MKVDQPNLLVTCIARCDPAPRRAALRGYAHSSKFPCLKCYSKEGAAGPAPATTAAHADDLQQRHYYKSSHPRDRVGPVFVATAVHADDRHEQRYYKSSHPTDKAGPVLAATAAHADDLH